MSRPPTLQSLALRARDSFGEDGYPFEDSMPSSLDVVVAIYAEAGDVIERAATALRRHLDSRGRVVAQAEVDEFVRTAITYLRVIYPDREAARDADERRTLSHLFWGNLVEARSAMGALDRPSSRVPCLQATPRVRQTLTCSCGVERTSGDEEELYRFARAHAAQQHPPPRQPLRPAAIPSSETGTPEAVVQRWQEDVVNGGDLAAIDGLSPTGPAEELKAHVTLLRTAFPDLRSTIQHIVVDMDEVAVRSTLEGTHHGAFRGVAPTGKHVSVEAYEFFRIRDDMIVERRGGVEESRLLQQLGVLPK